MTTAPDLDIPPSPLQADFRVVRSFLAPRGPRVRADAVLCFGCGDPTVPVRAAAVYQDGLAAHIVVTGRGRDDRPETEADEFGRVIADAGVPPERVVLERAARHTAENVTFGLAAARDRGLDVRSVVVVSHALSTRRCVATLARLAPGVVARSDPTLRATTGPVRASTMAGALRELHRLRTYPALGYFAEQAEPRAVTDAADRLTRALADAVPLDRALQRTAPA